MVSNHTSLSEVYAMWGEGYLATCLCWAISDGSLDVSPWCLYHITPQLHMRKNSIELAEPSCVHADIKKKCVQSKCLKLHEFLSFYTLLTITVHHRATSMAKVYHEPETVPPAKQMREPPKNRQKIQGPGKAAEAKKLCSSKMSSHSCQMLVNMERRKHLQNSM